MDDLDTRILAELPAEGVRSAAEIARRLAVSASSVRRRLKKLREDGRAFYLSAPFYDKRERGWARESPDEAEVA